MTRPTRFATLAAVVLAAVTVAALYVVVAVRNAASLAEGETGVTVDPIALRSLTAGPHVLFRSTRLGKGYGHVVAVAQDGSTSVRLMTDLECERVDMAGGVGVCLMAERGFQTTYRAAIFDDELKPLRTLPLAGVPSRVRVSPDGQLAAMTAFVSGHSYSQGDFSTLTTIVDTRTGEILADLESFAVEREGRPFKEVDFNFWGVTFGRDSNTIYATLGTGQVQLLVRGDVRRRRVEVIAEGIECPALSPDNSRIAFKKRIIAGGRLTWRLAVMDLSTRTEHLIDAETRSIDDQVQWLDNTQILYAVSDDEPGRGGTSIWFANADGSTAEPWAEGAYSPTSILE
jgi:hypothetical protein